MSRKSWVCLVEAARWACAHGVLEGLTQTLQKLYIQALLCGEKLIKGFARQFPESCAVRTKRSWAKGEEIAPPMTAVCRLHNV